jgi:hypothetical protein
VFDVRRLEPGESTSFTWDGRTVEATACTLSCGPQTTTSEAYALHPAPAGKYEMLVAVDTGAAVGCASTGDPDVYECGSGGTPGTFGVYAAMCATTGLSPSAQIVSTPFTLPSSGAAVVNVTLP